MAEPNPSAARVDAATAHLAAWAGLAAIDSVFVELVGAKVAPGLRVLHHAFDAGQLLAAGALVAGVVRLWERFGPKKYRRIAARAALGLVSFVLAWIFVRPDLANFSERLGGRFAEVLWFVATLGVAAWLPAAVELGTRLATPKTRTVGLSLAVVAALVNEQILAHDYRGAHLFIGMAAALLGGSSLVGERLPAWVTETGARRSFAVAHALAAAIGIVAVVVPPRPEVQAELVRVDGAIVAPLVARARKAIFARSVVLPANAGAWFHDRRHESAIPPSLPRLIPKDAIVLLVTVDSMKAVLFTEASSRAKLPRLDRLRNEAIDFKMARAPASRTVTTWSSVYTGKYYSGVAWAGINISKDPSVRFPMLLEKAGVHTENFMSVDQLGNGMMRGGFSKEELVRARKGQTYATSTEVIPKIIARLEQGVEGPLFVFAHLMDPHYPYDSVTNEGTPFERYLAEVGEADKNIGLLIDTIQRLGLEKRTVLIVGADHGEAFGQHDTRYHTTTLYEELIRVPLFIKAPGIEARQVSEPVSLMDLGPTILDLFGVATPGTFLGQSLVPFLRGDNPTLTRPIAAERVDTRAFVIGNRKVVVDTEKGLRQIFDLAKDPKETKNLLEELGPEGDSEIALMEGFFEAHAWHATAADAAR